MAEHVACTREIEIFVHKKKIFGKPDNTHSSRNKGVGEGTKLQRNLDN